METLTDAEFLRIVAEHFAGEQPTAYGYNRLMSIAGFIEIVTLPPPRVERPRNHLRIIPGGQKG
jgi:hypothetical protein